MNPIANHIALEVCQLLTDSVKQSSLKLGMQLAAAALRNAKAALQCDTVNATTFVLARQSESGEWILLDDGPWECPFAAEVFAENEVSQPWRVLASTGLDGPH
jgi:hypothetical protein